MSHRILAHGRRIDNRADGNATMSFTFGLPDISVVSMPATVSVPSKCAFMPLAHGGKFVLS